MPQGSVKKFFHSATRMFAGKFSAGERRYDVRVVAKATSHAKDVQHAFLVFGLPSATDYQRLLIDAMSGDQTLFIGPAEMRFLWEFLAPMLETWKKSPAAAPLHIYSDGSGGPEAADELIKRDGRAWL